MPFKLTARDLAKIMRLHSFPVPDAEILFFGLRGCLPVDIESASSLSDEHELEIQEVDYRNLRCTLGQWWPKDDVYALYPGSTVPHANNILKGKKRIIRVNRLEHGFFRNYRRGRHRHNGPTSHDAFRMDYPLPVRRTFDDLDYDLDDAVEYTHPFDNIHASYTESLSSDYFASAGCQVIMGYPNRKDGKFKEHTGPWKAFLERGYAANQRDFQYMLIPAGIAEDVGGSRSDKHHYPLLRFGSRDDAHPPETSPRLARQVQARLNALGYNAGLEDGIYGRRTWKAVLAFQSEEMGADQDDGVVGLMTAEGLELGWEKFA